MADWAKKIRAEFPSISIFGETLIDGIVNQAFFSEGQTVNQNLDTQLPGITDVQLKNAIYETLNGSFGWTSGVNRLYSVLANDFIYKQASKNVIFLDNHDMSRYFSVIGEDLNKFKSGLAILLTTRGIPQIYYGTEILMTNFSNPDGLVRSDFPGGWESDGSDKFTPGGRSAKENEAHDYFSKLANYRKNSPALKHGKLMQFVPQDGTYVYFRYDEKSTVMVLCNTHTSDSQINTTRFSERIGKLSTGKNIITNEILRDLSIIKVPAKTTLILELQ
jgi:glycosidase